MDGTKQKHYSSPPLAAIGRAFDTAKSKTASDFKSYSIIKPNLASRTWGWVHYGIFIPSLPAPLRYLNVMTLIGLPGVGIFDHDEFVTGGSTKEGSGVTDDPRRLATLMSSTADEKHFFYRGYDAVKECQFPQESTWPLVWGADRDLVLSIDEVTQQVHATANYGEWGFDLKLALADRAAWFISTPVYQHFSILATITGTIAGKVVSVHGAFDYARSLSPQSASSKLLPRSLRVPADFFTYHVIAIDERTQALLGEVHAWGAVVRRFGYVRRMGEKEVEFYAETGVDVSATEYMDEPMTDSLGRKTRVPRKFKLGLKSTKGQQVLLLTATVDSKLREGHGRGWIGAYTFEGTLRDQAKAGNGYFEFVDLAMHKAK